MKLELRQTMTLQQDRKHTWRWGKKELRQAAYDSVVYGKCPYCGDQLAAEPDATEVCCQHCSQTITIINPYF